MGWPQFASTFDDVVCLLAIFFFFIIFVVVVFGVFVSQKCQILPNPLDPWCFSFWHHCDGYSFRLDSLTFSLNISTSTVLVGVVVAAAAAVATTVHCLVSHFSVCFCFWVVCGNDGLEICQMSKQHRAASHTKTRALTHIYFRGWGQSVEKHLIEQNNKVLWEPNLIRSQ